MEEALDDWLYSSQGDSLEQIVLYYLGLRQATLAVAESCTGGLIAQRITSVPGSSRSFLGGAVVYSNEMKISFADVPPELISRHGAVSEEVAKALAEGIRKRTGATTRTGRHGRRRTGGSHRHKASGPGLHCGQRRTDHRHIGTQFSRRPGPRPRLGYTASARSDPQEIDVIFFHSDRREINALFNSK